jgi:hypothetical protein
MSPISARGGSALETCGVCERTWLRLFEHWYLRGPGSYDLAAITLAQACPSTCGVVGCSTRSIA